MSIRRIFGITWLVCTGSAAIWIVSIGFADETPDMLAVNTWLAIAFGLVVAGAGMFIPAVLLSAALWAIGLKKVQLPTGNSEIT